MTVLCDPRTKRALEQLCASQDITPSQAVRQLIREHLAKHGVEWSKPSGKKGRVDGNGR